MKSAHRILLRSSKQIRIQRLIEDYARHIEEDDAEIRRSIESLQKRIGKNRTAYILQELAAGNLTQVAETLLDGYYDPLYGYETTRDDRFEMVVDADDLMNATMTVGNYVDRVAREGRKYGHGG